LFYQPQSKSVTIARNNHPSFGEPDLHGYWNAQRSIGPHPIRICALITIVFPASLFQVAAALDPAPCRLKSARAFFTTGGSYRTGGLPRELSGSIGPNFVLLRFGLFTS
jgi:hypothetical protein